jgi:soluble epoxide hydrolase/lipid-phosphate phosphatase
MLGYNDTASPLDVERYSYKNVCGDLKALLEHEGVDKAVVVGHDWGGIIAWRLANYYPHIVEKLCVLCTPYVPPADSDTPYIPLDEVVKIIPSFRYQLYLNDTKCIEEINKDKKLFLQTCHRRYTDPQIRFVSHTEDIMSKLVVKPQTLMSDVELDVLVSQYEKQGFRGPTNWYRTRKFNHDDEVKANLPKEISSEIQTLFIAATKDAALPPTTQMLANTMKFVKNLEVKYVEAGHFIQVEAASEVNRILLDWLVAAHHSSSTSTPARSKL